MSIDLVTMAKIMCFLIYFAKFFLFLIGAFLVISLVIWFKDKMK